MEKDMTKKRCLSDNRRYADLINGFIFQGKQVVREEDLTELDTQSGIWSSVRQWGKRYTRPGYRDLIRKTAFGVNFAVVGMENQEEVHYLMPLRNMRYDISEYERQAGQMKKKVRREKGISKAEFLSGFRKTDRLFPCITVVLYFGGEWDGSRDLHGILDFTDIPDEIRQMVTNYPLHLLEVRKMENTDVFHTDLKQIFDFIRCSGDKKKLGELVAGDSAYREMDEDAYDMVVEYADIEKFSAMKKYRGKDGKIDMCEGLKGLIEDGKAEGRLEIITAFLSNGGTAQEAEKLLNASPEEIAQAKTQAGKP